MVYATNLSSCVTDIRFLISLARMDLFCMIKLLFNGLLPQNILIVSVLIQNIVVPNATQ